MIANTIKFFSFQFLVVEVPTKSAAFGPKRLTFFELWHEIWRVSAILLTQFTCKQNGSTDRMVLQGKQYSYICTGQRSYTAFILQVSRWKIHQQRPTCCWRAHRLFQPSLTWLPKPQCCDYYFIHNTPQHTTFIVLLVVLNFCVV